MPRFQVKAGQQLPHGGEILDAGSIVELPRHVAADSIVRDMVEEIDAAGNVVLAPFVNEFDQFRPHEQVTLLEALLAEAYARVEIIESQIALAKAASVAASVAAPNKPAPVDEE